MIRILLILANILLGIPIIFAGIVSWFLSDGGSLFDRLYLAIAIPITVVLVTINLFLKHKHHAYNQVVDIFASIVALWGASLSASIILGYKAGDWFVPILLLIPVILYGGYIQFIKKS